MTLHNGEINIITHNLQTPTFENTIDPFDNGGPSFRQSQ